MMQPDYSRLKMLMRRAARGEELTLAFFGGSITQGSLASAPEKCYAYHVLEWFEKTFPGTAFHYVNGGIGGTTSHYGAARVVQDCLMYQPDFVVVDFSVNDDPNDFFEESYEGVIRRILTWPSNPAVLLLNNVYYDTGINAEPQHNAVAAHYGLPHVSIRDSVYRRLVRGEFRRKDISPDGLHPNDIGHALVADEIIRLLAAVNRDARKETEEACSRDMGFDVNENRLERDNARKTACASGGGKMQAKLPAPMTRNAYEFARRLTIREISPALHGFYADPREKLGHLDHFKNGWIGRKAGDSVCFEAEAGCIALQYRKTVRHPALRAELVLDGDRKHAIPLDGNFEETWGDCLYLQPVLHHGERKKHTITVTILHETEDIARMTPFYLMSLIIA